MAMLSSASTKLALLLTFDADPLTERIAALDAPSPPKSPLFGVFGFGGIGFSHHATRLAHSLLRRAM